MAMSCGGAKSDDAVRREASDWVALIHDPDAAVDRAAFEHWRAADPRHATAYARAERAWDSAALLAQTSFGRARGLPERRRYFERPQIRHAVAAAAVLVVAILALSVGGVGLFRHDHPPQTAQFASSIGQIRQVALADGSIVTLDTDSVLRVAFTGDERRLTLSRGRARFDVAHDAARPFIVMAGKGSVTARGTIFDVAVLGDRVKVMLLRGAVDVRDGHAHADKSQPAMAHLGPGQQVSFAAAEPLLIPRKASATDVQWPTGMLNFDRSRLADVIAEANRYSTARINLADPRLGDMRITGVYHAGDAAGLAQGIADSLGLHVGKSPKGDIVISVPPSTAAP